MHSLRSILRRVWCSLNARAFFHDSSGMTLVEVAIVLAILGILGGLSLPLLTKQLAIKRVLKTQENQEKVLNSLAIFVLHHGRLPCPAKPSKEGESLKRCDSREQSIGLVPYETLGLSKAEASDGSKRTLTYMVEPALTRTAQLRGDFGYCDAVGTFLQLLNEDHTPVVKNTHDPIAVVILDSSWFEALRQMGDLVVNPTQMSLTLGRLVPSLSNASSTHIAWATRHRLVGWYGKFPCPPSTSYPSESL